MKTTIKNGTCTQRVKDNTYGVYSNYLIRFDDGSEVFYYTSDLALAIKYGEVVVDNLLYYGGTVKKVKGAAIPEISRTSKVAMSLLASNPRASIKYLMAAELMLAKRKGYKIYNVPTACGVDIYLIDKGSGSCVIVIPSKVTKIADWSVFGNKSVRVSNPLSLGLASFFVSEIKVMGGIGLLDASYMLYNLTFLKKVDFEHFYTSRVSDMSGMFSECSSLQSFNFRGFDTSKVKSMKYMFKGCVALRDMQLKGIDTSNVIDMEGMFKFCQHIECMDLSCMDTHNVRTMAYMFSHCGSITNLDLSLFSSESLISMDHMMSFCDSLSEVKFGGFEINNRASAHDLFCSSNKVKLI